MFLSGITIQKVVILILIVLVVFNLLLYLNNKIFKRTKYYQNSIEKKGIIKIALFNLITVCSSLLIISFLIYLVYIFSFD